MINPIAATYAALYPEPNLPGTEDNYFTNQLRPYDYQAFLGRVDHNFDSRNKLFLSAYYNHRQEDRYNWAKGAANATGEGAINGFLVTQGFDNRSNTGAILGFTSTSSSSTVLDVRASYTRFGEWRLPADTYDPASMGFLSTAAQLFGDYQYLPFITFGGFSTTNANSRIASLGAQRSDWSDGFDRPFTNIAFVPTLSKLLGSHSLRAGYELRFRRWNITNAGYGAGRYYFRGTYTRQNNSAPQDVLAQEFAQLLLGLPTTGTNRVANPGSNSSQFEINAQTDYRETTHSFFLQDDWRLATKLTLNLGVRFEIERPMHEADSRNLAGFDTTSPNPIEQAARAAYAANPIPEIPADQFMVRGGVLFEDAVHRNTLYKVLPRAAFSYSLNDKTVVRGGVGVQLSLLLRLRQRLGLLAADGHRHDREQRRHVPDRHQQPDSQRHPDPASGIVAGPRQHERPQRRDGGADREEDPLLHALADRLPARPGRRLGARNAVPGLAREEPAGHARDQRAAGPVSLALADA
jgi:hypothetical protein